MISGTMISGTENTAGKIRYWVRRSAGFQVKVCVSSLRQELRVDVDPLVYDGYMYDDTWLADALKACYDR